MWLLAALCASALCCDGHPARRAHTASLSLIEHLDDAEVAPYASSASVGPATVAGIERPAIVMALPSQVRFPAVTLRVGARLRFGVGLADDQRPRGPVELSVRLLDAAADAAAIWSGTLDPARRELRWQDVDVDLARYAGRTVSIALAAKGAAAGDGGRAVWSLPLLSSVAAGSDDTVTRRMVIRDLMGAASPPIDLGSFIGYGRVLQQAGGPVHRVVGSSRPSSKATRVDASHLRLSIEVPESASLELGAEVLRRPGTPQAKSGPVTFTARIDGTSVLDLSVDPQSAPVAFTRRVPLRQAAGAKVVVDLETRGADAKTIAWWTKAWLTETRPAARRAHAEVPNLLLVVVDTLRADHLGIYGATRPTSPNLDRFASDAAVFERAISSASWTQPAVATLLTGRSPMEHTVTGGVALPADLETLAESMQARGLTTVAVSANPIVGAREGFHRGFETFVHLPWARAATLNQAFSEWLSTNEDRPWFAYLHYIDPHDPYNAPPPLGDMFVGKLRGVVQDKPIELLHARNFGKAELPLTAADLELLRATYDGEIRYWDNALGAILRSLTERDALKRTVVIVMADHGEEFLDHGKLFHGFHLYEESIRVPLVIRAPAALRPGRYRELFETSRLKGLAERLVDGEAAGLLDADKGAAPRAGGGLAFAHTSLAFTAGTAHYRSLASVEDTRWKYILRLDDGNAELYDLASDPGERANRLGAEPALAQRYRAALKGWLGKDGRRADRSWTEPGMIERLRALGYVR